MSTALRYAWALGGLVALLAVLSSGAQAQQMGAGGVVYKFSPETFLGLHYSYANVENQFNGNTFAFDRQVVQLSLTQAFY